jgi:hypothetical protein
LLDPGVRDNHRIGGASIANLRLKPRETTLSPPGISVLKTASPGEAARQIRASFPKAAALHAASSTIGSSSEALIRSVGFDVVPAPTSTLPNHHGIVHPSGVIGFSDPHLALLASVIVDTSGHGP